MASGKPVAELVVAVLDKPRHTRLVAEVRAAGATVHLLAEGDVSAAVSAASGGADQLGGADLLPRVDLLLGVGGTPEGIIAACAVRALGGFMQGQARPAIARTARARHGGRPRSRTRPRRRRPGRARSGALRVDGRVLRFGPRRSVTLA
ncbi:MAG: fructose-bisphosphatase class II [Galbitalea sp.]